MHSTQPPSPENGPSHSSTASLACTDDGSQASSSADEHVREEQATKPNDGSPWFPAACGTAPHHKYWLNWRTRGITIACATYALHAYAMYVVTCILLPPWMRRNRDLASTSMGNYEFYFLHSTVFVAISVLACVSHFVAMTTDPGAVPPEAKPLSTTTNDAADSSDKTTAVQLKQTEASGGGPSVSRSTVDTATCTCRLCHSFKPPRAHHCSVCNRCIVKMDHHCPWINNCVGIGNHKAFLLFCFYTCIACIYGVALIVQRYHLCKMPTGGSGIQLKTSCVDHSFHWQLIWFAFLEGVLFGAFTAAMLVKQLRVVWTKATRIDRKQKQHEHLIRLLRGGPSGLEEVFGVNQSGTSRFLLGWLSPFELPRIPSPDKVKGYRL